MMSRLAHSVGSWVFLLLGLTLSLAGCDLSYPPSAWGDQAYDHAGLSGGFQLLGTHADAACTGCHAPGNYEPLFQASDGADCQACHREEYRSQHGDMGFPILCTLCHTPTVWSDGDFQHEESSQGFPLVGVHGAIPCTGCHDADTFEPIFDPAGPADCLRCHQEAFPQWHAQGGFPIGCGSCHSPTAWADGSFDHLAQSGAFALLGVHEDLPCTHCHQAGSMLPLYSPEAPQDCVACHASLFTAVHGGTGYPTTCVDCHTPTVWQDGEFNHPGVSDGFELLGVHETLPCTACHDPETFQPALDPDGADDCLTCHQADYDGKHGTLGYPMDCTLCHTPTAWEDGEFNHPAISGGFELLGTHAGMSCTACHDPDTFEPLVDPQDAEDCLSCHQADYDGQHGDQGYPTDCTLCHTATVWEDGAFHHEEASGFTLLGIHRDLACTACHDPLTFNPLFSPAGEVDCLSCHGAEYDTQHGSDGYPTTCLSCHTPTTWSDADFDHDGDYFPIFTGEHASRWSTCATCHGDPDDFADFTCFTCHAHQEQPMDQRHSGEAGYIYASTACLACHPDGTA